MSNNKQRNIALFGAMAMMSSQNEWEKQAFESFDHNENMYSGKNHSAPKTPLSKKQKKSRAKSKAARKARKK